MDIIDTDSAVVEAIERYLAPINDAMPCGEESKYEPCYEQMEEEVQKYGSLFGEIVDWSVVNHFATEVVTQHSKDLKATCYLVRALVEEGKVQGLESGLVLLEQMVVRFGAGLYPKRKRARVGAIEWLSNQLKITLDALPEHELDWAQLSRCNDAVQRIQGAMDEAFPDVDADFYDVKVALNGLMQRAPAVEPEPEFIPEPPKMEVNDTPHLNNAVSVPGHAQPVTQDVLQPDTLLQGKDQQQGIAQQQAATPQPVTRAAEPKKAVRSAPKVVAEQDVDVDVSSPTASKRSLKKVAELLLHSNLAEPLGYRINRYLTWFDVDEIPMNTEGVSVLNLPVSQDQQAIYADKSAQESDVDTIKRLERSLTDAPFWLTGHYLLSKMLKNLGMDEAASAVQQETAAFVRSLEGIETITFKNKVPFADEATQQWLQQTSTSSGGGSSSPMMLGSSQPIGDINFDDIDIGNLGETIQGIAGSLAQEISGRGRFLLNIQMVELYHHLALSALALPYLETIWAETEKLDLVYWEPQLFARLELLTQQIMMSLYPSVDVLPEKYQPWEHLFK
ncbi:type VI secretion system protein TssA [Vibrio sp.]|nr:type VI secretion system protein TssA [Vibrio sp.]